MVYQKPGRFYMNFEKILHPGVLYSKNIDKLTKILENIFELRV